MSDPRISPGSSDRAPGSDRLANRNEGRVVPIGAAVVIGAALRSAKRSIEETERRALLNSLRELADDGCAAAALVRTWLITRGGSQGSD